VLRRYRLAILGYTVQESEHYLETAEIAAQTTRNYSGIASQTAAHASFDELNQSYLVTYLVKPRISIKNPA